MNTSKYSSAQNAPCFPSRLFTSLPVCFFHAPTISDIGTVPTLNKTWTCTFECKSPERESLTRSSVARQEAFGTISSHLGNADLLRLTEPRSAKGARQSPAGHHSNTARSGGAICGLNLPTLLLFSVSPLHRRVVL